MDLIISVYPFIEEIHNMWVIIIVLVKCFFLEASVKNYISS